MILVLISPGCHLFLNPMNGLLFFSSIHNTPFWVLMDCHCSDFVDIFILNIQLEYSNSFEICLFCKMEMISCCFCFLGKIYFLPQSATASVSDDFPSCICLRFLVEFPFFVLIIFVSLSLSLVFHDCAEWLQKLCHSPTNVLIFEFWFTIVWWMLMLKINTLLKQLWFL